MSDCGVCIYQQYDDYADIYETSIARARKSHTCCECGGHIAQGEKYEKIAMFYDGRWSHYDTCLVCSEIATAFCCEGRCPTELWNGMYEVMGALTTACFDRLETPKAKTELQRRWRGWKGL